MLKRNFLRFLALSLAAVMLLAVLGCNSVYDIERDKIDRPWENSDGESDGDGEGGGGNNNGGNNNGDGEDGDEEESLVPIIPIEPPTFEAQALTVLCRDAAASSREWYKQAPEDELDEVIALRNAKAAQELDVVVNYDFVPDEGYDKFAAAFNGKIITDVTADLHYYDIAANFAYAGAYTGVRDFAANLLDIEQFPFFDFDIVCWNKSIVENTTFNGRLHYVTGSLNLSSIDAAMLLWYNKDLYDTKRTEEDPADLMQHALDGNWTYEDLYRIVAAVYPPEDNFFGMAGWMYRNGQPCDLLPTAWEIDLVVENNDGTHSFSIDRNQKLRDALDKYSALFSLNGNCHESGAQRFASGESIFTVGVFYDSQSSDMILREMTAAHSFLPWPKYDAEQENYHTTSRDHYTLITVLDHAESTVKTHGGAVSAYLQLASEYSYIDVAPVYKNHRVTKTSNLPDHEKVGAMYDLIVNSITYDFRSVYSPQLNNVTWLWRDNMDSADKIIDRYLSEIDKFDSAIRDTDMWLGLTASVPS